MKVCVVVKHVTGVGGELGISGLSETVDNSANRFCSATCYTNR